MYPAVSHFLRSKDQIQKDGWQPLGCLQSPALINQVYDNIRNPIVRFLLADPRDYTLHYFAWVFSVKTIDPQKYFYEQEQQRKSAAAVLAHLYLGKTGALKTFLAMVKLFASRLYWTQIASWMMLRKHGP
jgi:hypothetical protein